MVRPSSTLHRASSSRSAPDAGLEAYYDTIYARETAKTTAAATLLDKYRRVVDALHDRVGLTLQVQAESDGHADPALPQQELRQLVLTRLAADEYETAEASALADKLVQAATERLVLLVPRNDTDVGFEVRSLQEFMAARALVSGDEDSVLERLRRAAPSSHWRNTWLLAARRVAARQEHLIDQLLSVVAALDAQDYLALQLAPGADLTADLLDDGFAATSPKTERLLLRQAVELLRSPINAASITAADLLQRASTEGSSGGSRVIADVAVQGARRAVPRKDHRSNGPAAVDEQDGSPCRARPAACPRLGQRHRARAPGSAVRALPRLHHAERSTETCAGRNDCGSTA